MKVVYKYELQYPGFTELELPVRSAMLSAAFQGDKLVLWVQQDPTAPKCTRRVLAVETGQSIAEGPGEIANFVDTAQRVVTDVRGRPQLTATLRDSRVRNASAP